VSLAARSAERTERARAGSRGWRTAVSRVESTERHSAVSKAAETADSTVWCSAALKDWRLVARLVGWTGMSWAVSTAGCSAACSALQMAVHLAAASAGCLVSLSAVGSAESMELPWEACSAASTASLTVDLTAA
jgi:hypothetical protein